MEFSRDSQKKIAQCYSLLSHPVITIVTTPRSFFSDCDHKTVVLHYFANNKIVKIISHNEHLRKVNETPIIRFYATKNSVLFRKYISC